MAYQAHISSTPGRMAKWLARRRTNPTIALPVAMQETRPWP